MLGAAQQVQQGLVVVFAGGLQRFEPLRQFALKVGHHKALGHQRVAHQLVDHAGVLQQVAGGPFGGAQQGQQLLVHGRALQQQGQVAFAAHQGFEPVGQAPGSFQAAAAFAQPLGGALHDAEQPRAGLVAQVGHARVVTPLGHAFAKVFGQLFQQAFQLGRWRGRCLGAAAAAAAALLFLVAAQQGVEFLRHQLAVGVQLVQKGAAVGVAHGAGNPGQVVVACGQHMGLLVVQVLNAVLHLAQKDVGAGHGVGRFLRHQPGLGQALQGLQRGAAAQLGELAPAHHLQELHGEFNLADAAARELHVVGALGVARAALGGVVADLAVQRTQRIEHAVVQVAAEDKRQHHPAQGLHLGAANAAGGGHHAALEPGKALPLAALHLQILFQCRQRDGRRAGVAVGPQGQVHPEDKAVLGGVAHQAVDGLDGAGEVFVVGDAAPAALDACGVAVVLIHIDQVDVARHVQLARAQLAHADDPQLHRLALRALGRAVAAVQLFAGVAAGVVQGQFGQLGHSAGDVAQGRTRFAVQADEPLHDQLPHRAQGAGHVHTPRAQGGHGLFHRGPGGSARRQQGQVLPIAAVQPLEKARMLGLPVTGRNGGAGGKGGGNVLHGRRGDRRRRKAVGGTRQAQQGLQAGRKVPVRGGSTGVTGANTLARTFRNRAPGGGS